MSVAVVTDTTAYLPRDMVAEEGIHLVSLYVNWEDGSEREADMEDFEAFYERLRHAQQLPTTSQPSIGDFLAVYDPLVDAGMDVVSIHISSGLSGTTECARQAAVRVADRRAAGTVTVIDSETGCGGLGIVAIAAARAARAGATADEVFERAKEARSHLKMWFAVDTLEYLRRGGRIGGAAAWVGTTLKIKPILTCEKTLVPIERVRTGRRALKRLAEFVEQRKADGAEAWVVQHVQAPDEARQLAERCEQVMERPALWISEIGPVIGAHVGPGLVGVGGVPLSDLEPQRTTELP